MAASQALGQHIVLGKIQHGTAVHSSEQTTALQDCNLLTNESVSQSEYEELSDFQQHVCIGTVNTSAYKYCAGKYDRGCKLSCSHQAATTASLNCTGPVPQYRAVYRQHIMCNMHLTALPFKKSPLTLITDILFNTASSNLSLLPLFLFILTVSLHC
jgi:hypothetical protein